MNGKRIHLSVIDSTNTYTMNHFGQSGISHGTIVYADFQSSGKGQRGRKWEGEVGMNLTFSIALEPNLEAAKQFRLSAAVSLSIIDLLEKIGLAAELKWPNDILVSGQKVCGMLIENQISGDQIEFAAVGIGLNVNQVYFDEYNWPASSLKLESRTSNDFNLNSILTEFERCFWLRYDQIMNSDNDLIAEVNERLYKKGKVVSFTSGEKQFEGLVSGVNLNGELVLKIDGEPHSFASGEISFRRTSP